MKIFKTNYINDFIPFLKICFSFVNYRIFVIIFLTLTATIIETFALTSILPVVNLIFDGNVNTNLQVDFLSGFFNFFLSMFNNFDMLDAVFFLLTILVIRTSILIFSDIYRIRIRYLILSKIRKNIIHGIFNSDYELQSSKDSGYYNNIISEQTDKFAKAFETFIRISVSLIQATLLIFLSISISFKLNIIILFTLIIIYPIFNFFANSVSDYSKKFVNETTKLSSWINQSIQSIEYLKITNQVKKINKLSLNSIDLISKYLLRMFFLGSISARSVEPIVLILLTLFFAFGTELLGYKPDILILSFLFLFRGMTNLLNVQQKIIGFNSFIGPIRKINNEIKKFKLNPDQIENDSIVNFNKSLEFKNISFKFKKDNNIIFDEINFKIKPNDMVGIIGPSGSGKSTFTKIFSLLLKPDKGSIYIDDNKIDLNKNFGSWRDKIGYISQKLYIYRSSIMDNITLNFNDNKNSNINMDLIIKLSKDLNLYNFIQSLPNKYNEEIAELGHNFSSGQIQRILILRELYRNKSILIFDEPTSSLDEINRNNFIELINQLKSKHTIIIISHDKNIIKNLPKVYEIVNNKLIKKEAFHKRSIPNFN